MDEVDRMLELGFEAQLNEITEQSGLSSMESGRQTSMWSATVSVAIRELAGGFLRGNSVWVNTTGDQAKPLVRSVQQILVDARPLHRSLRTFSSGTPVIRPSPWSGACSKFSLTRGHCTA